LPDEQFNELLKLRGETGVLRRQLDELAEKNRALQNVNTAMLGSHTNPPVSQIHIKARFLTMPKDVLSGLGGASSFNGILTSENASNVLSLIRWLMALRRVGENRCKLTSSRNQCWNCHLFLEDKNLSSRNKWHCSQHLELLAE